MLTDLFGKSTRLVPACCLFLAPASVRAAVLYSQNFTGGGNGNLAAVNWEGWGALGDTAPATTYTTVSGTSPNSRLFRTSGTGSNRALFAQSRNSGTPDTVNDRFVAMTTSAGTHTLGSNPETSLGVLRWDQSTTVPGSQSVQVIVQVGGSWYASLASFTNTTTGSAGSFSGEESKSLDLAGAQGLGTTAWYNITFGEGLPIAIGSQVETPIGTTLTGLGFAMFTGTGSPRTVWIDNVELLSIPEPSAAMLAGMAVVAGLASRRRQDLR